MNKYLISSRKVKRLKLGNMCECAIVGKLLWVN